MTPRDFKYYHLRIALETTNKCKLKCPSCSRQTSPASIASVKDITLESYQKIVDAFTAVSFCGELGDSIYHPQFKDLLRMSKPLQELQVVTNGSHKSLDWWEEVFDIAAANNNTTFRFSLDGLPNESHTYRINQRGEEVWEVMKLGVAKGLDIVWQYIPFKYNEDHIDQAKSIAKDNGMRFFLKKSNRHPKGMRPVDDSLTIPVVRHIPYFPKRKKGEVYHEETIDKALLDIAHHAPQIHDLKPLCISGNMVPIYTGSGTFLPCCWCGDGEKGNIIRNDPYFINNGFYDMNIEDVDDITSEIFQSKPWLEFFDLLQNDPLSAPACCKKKCGITK